MIFSALLLIASPALDAFDEANLALTQCGFAAHRRAAQANEGLDQFKSALGSRCAAEIAQMRRAIVAVETGRGKSSAAAQAHADETIALFHHGFAEGYAQRHESEAKLKALIDVLEKEGKSDAR